MLFVHGWMLKTDGKQCNICLVVLHGVPWDGRCNGHGGRDSCGDGVGVGYLVAM